MAKIELKNIEHIYKSVKKKENKETIAIRGVNLCWEDGSANALLGPSGCGKTTLLNIISGLLKPTRGKVLFDGKDVTNLTPQEKNIAQVFQFPVNYDSMSIFGNLAFPLRNDGLPKEEIKKRVKETADIVGLTDKLYTSCKALNADDKHKVSLARNIIRRNINVLLLDEPLTDLDPHLKWSLRRKIKEVQSETKITTIYVTHDQHEALTFADKIVVMKDGRIIQIGTPEELYSNPQAPFIGYFIGSPGMNFFDCLLSKDKLDFEGFSINISSKTKLKLMQHGFKFQLGIRPEFVQTSKERKKGWIPLNVEIVEDIGCYKILTLASNNIRIKSRLPAGMSVLEGEVVWVNFPEDKIKVYKDDLLIY